MLSPMSSSKLMEVEESLKQARTDLLLKLFNDKMELQEERFSSMAAHKYFTEKAVIDRGSRRNAAKSNNVVRNSNKFSLGSHNNEHAEKKLHFKDVKVA